MIAAQRRSRRLFRPPAPGSATIDRLARPVGVPRKQTRVLRGGSWNNNADNARGVKRNRNSPDKRNDNNGFRVVSSTFQLPPIPERSPTTGLRYATAGAKMARVHPVRTLCVGRIANREHHRPSGRGAPSRTRFAQGQCVVRGPWSVGWAEERSPKRHPPCLSGQACGKQPCTRWLLGFVPQPNLRAYEPHRAEPCIPAFAGTAAIAYRSLDLWKSPNLRHDHHRSAQSRRCSPARFHTPSPTGYCHPSTPRAARSHSSSVGSRSS
jgi:hypothetical protein